MKTTKQFQLDTHNPLSVLTKTNDNIKYHENIVNFLNDMYNKKSK